MAKEIERKFLVTDDSYRLMAREAVRIEQGYISRNPDAPVRVRLRGDCGYLTVKRRNVGAVRDEWEYSIPAADAAEMLAKICPCRLEKTRYVVDYAGLTWEVDEFHGALAPLVVAEVELPAENTELELPPFVGREVTGDVAYYNTSLIARLEKNH